MKKFKLFGFKFIFKMEKENQDDIHIYSESYNLREKIIYLLLVMTVLSFSSKFYLLFNQNSYKKGSIVKENIYAPKTVKYNDTNKREAIIEELILTSKKEYIHVPEVEVNHYNGMKNFYDQILALKKGTKIDFNYKIIEETIGKDVNKNLVKEILELSTRKIKAQREELLELLQKTYESGVTKDDGIITIKDEQNEKIEKLSPLEKKVLHTFLVPNYIFDKEKTKEEIEKKTSKIGPQIVEVQAGSIIAKKGEVITEKKLEILSALGIYSYADSILRFLINGFYLLLISFISYHIIGRTFKKEILNKNIYRAVFLLIAGAFVLLRFINNEHMYIIPFEVIFFMLGILVNAAFAFTMGMVCLLFLMPMLDYNLIYFFIYLFSILLGEIMLKDIKTRSQLINLGVQLSIVRFILFLILCFFLTDMNVSVVMKAGEIIIAGILSGMLSIALVPYFERTFNILTRFKLLELGDLSHPLLRDLSVKTPGTFYHSMMVATLSEAFERTFNILTRFKLLELGDLSHPLLRDLSVKTPGTFYHSMMVATLSEAAADAVGADSIFTRVACYYHDIGKMKRPKFYVENQEGGVNPHNAISPFLSALIIAAHTKEGAELGKEYKIPKEIRDIMYEHQGTTLLAYFYNKAKQIDENVQEEDFRYPGPKPKTKESAIIMLADSIEAAVRSLDEKTPVTIEAMIRKIIAGKMDDGQLSDADLTFKEIETIIKVFTKTLMGIHHVRIKYPGQK